MSYPFRIVGIGASAGGLDAIYEFFRNMSDDTGMAFVVIQHLSPDFKSLMNELLPKYTSMPVEIIRDKILPKPNHVYLLPSDKHVSIEQDRFSLLKRAPRPKAPLPINVFLQSLAKNSGAKSIAVVLSGSGTDGSKGVSAVQSSGGLVFIQDPVTAQFPSMPEASIAAVRPDSILPPFAIAKELVRLIKTNEEFKKPNNQQAKKIELLKRILNRVEEVCGVDFKDYRIGTLLRRTEKRMQLNQLPDLGEYFLLLLDDEKECRTLFKEFLIGVTRFFRDKGAFEALKESVLPKILETKNTEEEIRIWTVGCASGEEAYSIAILLNEYLEKNRLPHSFKIFATDLDAQAIKTAGTGVFDSRVKSDIKPDLFEKYFTETEEGFLIDKKIREQVIFAVHDAIQDPPFIRLDLVSCRNMLIYLNSEMQQKLLTNFQFALNYKGFLFLGASEATGAMKTYFESVSQKWKLFQSISENKKRPLSVKQRIHSEQLFADLSGFAQYKPKSSSQPLLPDLAFSKILADRYAPRALFVNEELDILYLNGYFDELLHFPRSAKFNLNDTIGENDEFVFKNGIRQAKESGKVVLLKNTLFKKRDKVFHLDLTFEKIKSKSWAGISVFLILFQIQDEPKKSPSDDSEVIDLQNNQSERLLTVEKELQKSQIEKQHLIEKLEAANEELQSSNEELISTNEELQSTNEELQSVNEELYTVNTELQHKIEELTLTNSDINNLLKSTEIGTVFLDLGLRIRKFTPALQEQFNLRGNDIGRPITHFTNAFQDAKIYEDINRVLKDLTSIEREVLDAAGNHFLMRILPYRTENNVITGVVLTFVNINELHETMAELAENEEKFRAVFENSLSQITITDLTGVILSFNFLFEGYEKVQVEGQSIYDFLLPEYESEFRKAFETAKSKQISTTLIQKLINPDGRNYWLSSVIKPIVVDNKVKYITLITQDVTEEKTQELNLRSLTENFEEQLYSQKAALQQARRQLEYSSHYLEKFLEGATRYLENELNQLEGILKKDTSQSDVLEAMLHSVMTMFSDIKEIVGYQQDASSLEKNLIFGTFLTR